MRLTFPLKKDPEAKRSTRRVSSFFIVNLTLLNTTAVMIESSVDGSFLRNDIPQPLDTLEGKTTGLLIVPWFVLGERTRQARFKICVGSFQT